MCSYRISLEVTRLSNESFFFAEHSDQFHSGSPTVRREYSVWCVLGWSTVVCAEVVLMKCHDISTINNFSFLIFLVFAWWLSHRAVNISCIVGLNFSFPKFNLPCTSGETSILLLCDSVVECKIGAAEKEINDRSWRVLSLKHKFVSRRM